MDFIDEDLEVIEDLATIEFIANVCELGEILESNENKKSVHPINKERDLQGHGNNLLLELFSYEDRFYNYTRMSVHSFEKLLNLLQPQIRKKITGRTPILPEIRLAITLR